MSRLQSRARRIHILPKITNQLSVFNQRALGYSAVTLDKSELRLIIIHT
jgi:hypothetical protein